MGKTPKKAAPGGDERNLYVRRLKATTSTSRASESSLPEKHREYESTNRPKQIGIQKKTPAKAGTNFKSKLRIPSAKVGLNQPTKQLKLPMKNPEAKTTDMQLESEEAKAKLNVKEENSNSKAAGTSEQSTIDKAHVPEQTSRERQISTKTTQGEVSTESRTISQEKEEVSLENVNTETKEVDEQEDDVKLTLDIEQSPTRNGEEELVDKRLKDNKEKELPALQEELKNGVNEKDEIQSEAQTDESCSVDIVESTTSEISETSESVSQSDTQKDKEKIDDTINNDASFISYDSSIMLKDVKIKLNDCLKDNSKLFDVSNAEDTPSYLPRDMSFGKTLRNISGRNSIGRMRHVTLRERRISPNSSLFVNTSTISMAPEEGAESKVLHYSGLLSDSFPTNGSPLDRKRKLGTEACSSAKKQKTDAESSLLSTSLGLIKGLRNIQVSTPKITSYKFESTSKLDISGVNDDDNKITVETTESTKRWCIIM